MQPFYQPCLFSNQYLFLAIAVLDRAYFRDMLIFEPMLIFARVRYLIILPLGLQNPPISWPCPWTRPGRQRGHRRSLASGPPSGPGQSSTSSGTWSRNVERFGENCPPTLVASEGLFWSSDPACERRQDIPWRSSCIEVNLKNKQQSIKTILSTRHNHYSSLPNKRTSRISVQGGISTKNE